MASEHSRDRVDIRIETDAFPTEMLRVERLSGTEAISRLFSFDLDVISLDRSGLDLDSVAGALATLVIERDGVEVRRIHGMVSEIDDRLAAHTEFRAYRFRLVPRAFRLSMIQTQDIFMDMSVPEIIATKLAIVGLGKSFDLRLVGRYPKREFVVQYAETDLAFVARLAEHLGMSFFFEHQNGEDRIVFTDHRKGFTTTEEVAYRARGDERDVFELSMERRLCPGYYAVRDYDYRHPQLDLTADHVLPTGDPGGAVEEGLHHVTPEEGLSLAMIRAEERLASQKVYVGRSDLGLAPGARSTLEGHPDLDSVGLLITEVQHQATAIVAGGGHEDGLRYTNAFRATPAENTYRPARATARPRISGFITAIVDPGDNEESAYAQLDDQGRYLVRFLFDTSPPGDRPSSLRVRMMQNHVGENYGVHMPLKAGTEVLVGFVHGDPDRPVIAGAVPNPRKPSPVTDRNPGYHCIKTASGISINIVDEW